ncbi:MAG: InlB B-repeat-containing protein, partial [Bacilli bacterium]
LDGSLKQIFDARNYPNASNTTMLWGEGIVSVREGVHRVELKDYGSGAITVVNVSADIFFNAPKYTVRFNDSNGTKLKSQLVPRYSNATPPSNPTLVGHTFTGWQGNYENVTENRTITAKYEINKYTVRFVDWNGTQLKSQSVNYGSGANAPPNPTRTGYTFTGWNKAFNYITSNLTVTAQYRINKYKTYTSNWLEKDFTEGAWNPSGTLNDVQTYILHGNSNEQQIAYGSYYFPKAIDIDGYYASSSFGYWNPNWQGSLPMGNGFPVYGNSGGEITYHKKSYNVHFLSNGGTDVSTQSIKYRNKAKTPASPTRGTDKFMGWYTDWSLTKLYDFNTQVKENFNLYAKWDKKPILKGEDMVIAEDMYTLDEWLKVRIEDAVANDFEDGNITSKITVPIDNTNLSKKGIYRIVYQVIDSVGNVTRLEKKVTVIDKTLPEDKENKYVRSISNKYIDTLKPNSKWRAAPLNSILTSTLSKTSSDQAKEIWYLTPNDVEKIKEFNKTHDYSPASNQLFKTEFSYLRKK